MTLHIAPPIPFDALSAEARYALILHVQCEAEGYGHDPITEREAERYIEQLTDVGYARLIAAFHIARWRRG